MHFFCGPQPSTEPTWPTCEYLRSLRRNNAADPGIPRSYDFYKPHLSSEYPEVDGPLTQTSYPGALERSYDHFRIKESKRKGGNGDMGDVSLEDFDYVAFHSPYGKLVQKGFSRLVSSRSSRSPNAH